jgi:hypothetical protein
MGQKDSAPASAGPEDGVMVVEPTSEPKDTAHFFWGRLQEQLASCAKLLEPEKSVSMLRYKREACCGINGMWSYDVLCPYGESRVMKPQWLHSATAVYLLLRKPEMRHKSSFAWLIVRGNLVSEYIELATEVLRSDDEGRRFLDAIEPQLSNAIIVDKHSDSTLVVAADGQSAVHVTSQKPIVAFDSNTMKPVV